jgi:hypothetical protein
MKRALVFIILIVVMSVSAGCSSSQEQSSLKLADILQKFKDGGLPTEGVEQPVPESVGAIDGFIFYDNNYPVKVYEYKSAKALKDAKDIFPKSVGYPRKGRFLLVSSHDKAIEIFNSIQ